MRADVVVVGGGPAGLAVAIGAAQRGLEVLVLEKRGWPIDKGCGEGLMPAGVRALERLGARSLLDAADCSSFIGVRYVQEDGSDAEACFPRTDGEGLGIRRLALSSALARRANEAGATLRADAQVRSVTRTEGRMRVSLGDEIIDAGIIVAADGLHSSLRRAAGLDVELAGPRRFGLRQHFRCAQGSPFVEVHFAEGVEAYVTPVGTDRIGVAFLWEDGVSSTPVSFSALLALFPVLQERLRDASPDSDPRGAGPLLVGSRRCTTDGMALIGDAAGYVDAITGEGLSLAFHCAEALSAILPEALARGGDRRSLRAYERAFSRAFARYAYLTRGLLLLSRRPALRRAVVHMLARFPRMFERILGALAS